MNETEVLQSLGLFLHWW